MHLRAHDDIQTFPTKLGRRVCQFLFARLSSELGMANELGMIEVTSKLTTRIWQISQPVEMPSIRLQGLNCIWLIVMSKHFYYDISTMLLLKVFDVFRQVMQSVWMA